MGRSRELIEERSIINELVPGEAGGRRLVETDRGVARRRISKINDRQREVSHYIGHCTMHANPSPTA